MYYRWLGAILFVATFVSCANPGLAAPPVEAFGSLPAIGRASLSPDGKHLAIIGPVNGRNAVTIFTLDAPDAKPMRAAFPDADAIGIQWANDNRLICTFKANIKRHGTNLINVWEHAVSVALDGGNAVVLMHDAPFYADSTSSPEPSITTDTAEVVDMDPADPDHVYMVAYETSAQMEGNTKTFESLAAQGEAQTDKWVDDVYFLNFFKVNVSTGESDIVLRGTPETIRFVTDGAGHAVGRIDRTSDLMDHYYTGTREVAKFDARAGDYFDVMGVNTEGSSLLVSSYGNGDTLSLFDYQFGASTLGPVYFSDIPRMTPD